ncbi:MAG: hypothetical protein KAH17_08120 [Bacteroidales bacterium]|nr:hypothetical protein [Bacteroidales bacterium]
MSDHAFSSYIQSRTVGVVSSQSSIVLILNQALPGYDDHEELPDGLFECKPAIDGKAFLVNGNQLEFHPDEDLKSGQKYSVDFHLGKLISVARELRVFNFDFEVLPLDFSVQKGRLVLSESDKNLLDYHGKIFLSDPMEVKTVQSLLKLEGADVEMDLLLEEGRQNVINYRIQNISKKTDSWSFILSWNGRSIKLDKKGELIISIPGKNEFSLLDVEVEQGEDQHIRLVFSDFLNPRQSLKGLIHLEGTDQYRLQKSGHEVFLYPLIRLDGEWNLVIEKEIQSSKGKSLHESETFHLALAPLPPKVEFLGSGYIMPELDGLYLPFRAVSLRAVDLYVYKIYSNNIQQFLQQNSPSSSYSFRGNIKYVGRPVFRKTIRLDEDPGISLGQWNSYSFDLAPLVREDPHALYHVEIRIRKELGSFVCEDQSVEDNSTLNLISESFSDEVLAGYQDGNYYYENLYPDNYYWRDRDNPCSSSYYTPDKFVYKNVLATNLGVLAKSGNQKDFLLVVTDLLTADPVTNATVEFYNFQQQQILAGTTGSDGLSEMSLAEVPYLLVVSSGDQKAYLRVDDGSSLSLSNFDVAGEKVEGGIKGVIYGERGVWRPGDTLHLSFALFDKDNIIPDDLPVVLEVYNARRQLSHKAVTSDGIDGFYTFPVPTEQDDPTGNWRALVKVGGVQFSKMLKIENIKPNRLKIELQFNRKVLSANDSRQTLDFRSQWLHGAPAAAMRAEVNVKLATAKTDFKGYDRFSFSDPLKKFRPNEIMVFDDLLDQKGEATVPLDLRVSESAPGMLSAIFTSRVYEKGGDFSTDVYSVPFSPYDRYVGLSIRGMDSPGSQLTTDTLHTVDVITLDKEGQSLAVRDLRARVYKIQWRWWWSSQRDDLASFIGSEHENLIYETSLSTSNGKGSFSFKVDYPNWGRYLVHVSDLNGGHAAGQIIYLDWPSWVNRSGRANPAGATMLTFSADKKEYKTGDKAALTFPSMKGGRALLTIESGSRVIESRWIKTKETETRVDLEITEEMAPNVYASISLIQSHAHDENDLPIRQYGVLRLVVENPDSRLNPEIELPEELRPDEMYKIKVSESDGRAMTYTLAIVDQGLLSLTRYKTPDLWKTFYATEALGVKTWDMYDDVLGAFGGRIESLLAIGGDEGEIQGDAKKANRFEPVVTFMGPFELKKNRSDTHKMKMPNYVGQVKAMVIAGKGIAWGSAEAVAPVRQPVMVLTSLPRRLTPGEKVDLPVSVFVMKEGLSKVTVRLIAEGPVHCSGETEKEIEISGLGEQMVYFSLTTAEQPGIASIRVEVSSGNEKASHSTEIEVINPNPYIYRTTNYLLEPGDELEVGVNFIGMKGSNSGTLSVSGIPSFNLEKNLQYLVKYPYGCVEQTTSAAFVQLFLNRLIELDESTAEKVDKNIRGAIKKLSGFQLSGGGLSFWSGSSGVSLWGTSYATHFLLMAEKEGYVIPYSFREKLIKFQNLKASAYSGRSAFPGQPDYAGDSDLQQAYRLYTLALATQANLSAMNRLREKAVLDQPAAWRLAAAYALMGRKDVAEELVSRHNPDEMKSYTSPGSSFGSAMRDKAMILETMILLERKEDAFMLVRELARDLQNQRWSTQSTAFGLLAMAQFANDKLADEMMRFTLQSDGEEDKVNTQMSVYQLLLEESDEGNIIKVINRDEGLLFVDLITYGQSITGESEPVSDGLEINFQFTDLGGQAIDIGQVKQGTSFLADVWIQNSAINGQSDNLALSQIFPSGWEILSTRYADQTDIGNESSYDYRDIRDDRVNTFFSLKPGARAHFQVKLNAAYTGRFYMPPISCEDMYRPEISASTGGIWIEVVK